MVWYHIQTIPYHTIPYHTPLGRSRWRCVVQSDLYILRNQPHTPSLPAAERPFVDAIAQRSRTQSKRKANDVTLNCPSPRLGSFGHSHVSQAIRTGHQDKCTPSLSTKSTPLSFDHTFTIERATRCNPPQPTSIPPTPVEALRAAISFPQTQRQLSLLEEEESVCHGQPRRNNSWGG